VASASTDPTAIDEHSIVRPSRTTGTIEVDGNVVVVDESAGRAHALNETGSLVWQCLDGTGALGDLVDDLATEFAGSRDAIGVDVVDLVRSFGALGLLDGVGPDAAALPPEIQRATAGECAPDDEPGPDASFDDRYLAAPPNG
jgi:hypothetical protein